MYTNVRTRLFQENCLEISWCGILGFTKFLSWQPISDRKSVIGIFLFLILNKLTDQLTVNPTFL